LTGIGVDETFFFHSSPLPRPLLVIPSADARCPKWCPKFGIEELRKTMLDSLFCAQKEYATQVADAEGIGPANAHADVQDSFVYFHPKCHPITSA
jgi:hypothetical protein